MTESDPHGINQHEAGAKLDKGKVRVGLVLGSFPRALWKVCEVGTFGAGKYTDNGWLEVPDAEARYTDAGLRHYLKACMGEVNDPDSEIEHLAHEVWNALARLELQLRKEAKPEEKKRPKWEDENWISIEDIDPRRILKRGTKIDLGFFSGIRGDGYAVGTKALDSDIDKVVLWKLSEDKRNVT